jgi:hypothetical protein
LASALFSASSRIRAAASSAEVILASAIYFLTRKPTTIPIRRKTMAQTMLTQVIIPHLQSNYQFDLFLSQLQKNAEFYSAYDMLELSPFLAFQDFPRG